MSLRQTNQINHRLNELEQMLKEDGHDNFIIVANGLVHKYNNSKDNGDYHFSTKPVMLPEKMEYLNYLGLRDLNSGFWNVFFCTTCHNHHDGKASFHCEINYT